MHVHVHSNLGAIKVMANSLGYEVVHIVGFFDMYLVQRDLLQGMKIKVHCKLHKSIHLFFLTIYSPTCLNISIINQ